MEAALAQHRLAVLLPLPSQRRLKLRRDKWSCTCPPLPRSHYLQSKLRLETSASAPAAPEPSFSALLPHGARNNEAISLPLDYYRLLGLSRSTAAASRDAVRRSYERALGSPPDVGFSHDVLFSRAVLLRDAAECLSQLETRRAYDAAGSSSGGHVLDVSMINLPGALVLLQEAGEAALVISLGRAWLADANSDGLAPDVAAAVALAHCDEAADALAADNSVVLVACRHLEAALQLLRRYKMAPQLQQQIMQTLEDYSPRYALELLQQPLEEARVRRRGLALLRRLAFELPPHLSPLGRERDAFLISARAAMTAEEQLTLYSSLPSGLRLSAHCRLDAAAACVVVGHARRAPLLLQRAAGLYRQLQSDARQERAALDVSVERAAVALMLGRPQDATALLGLEGGVDGTAAAGTDDSIKAFVRECCPQGGDLLPGVYALSQAWLQAAADSFRAPAQPAAAPMGPPELAPWFGARSVQLFIRATTLLGHLHPMSAGPAVGALLVWLLRGGLTAASAKLMRWALSVMHGEQQQQQQQQQQHARAPSPTAADGATEEEAHADDCAASMVLSEPDGLDLARLKRRLGAAEPGVPVDAGTDGQPGPVAALHQRMQLQLLEAAVWDAEPAQAAMPLWTRASAVAIAALLLFAMAATGPRTTRGSAGNTWASGPLPASCRC